MSDDEMSFGVTIPLDSDGFLRRECPTCEREFKWRPTPEEDAEPAQDDGYFCPYCGVQAPIGAWLTQGQLALAQNIIATQAIGPMVSKIGKYQGPAELDPLTEADDMILIDFPCHPAEPLKVQDDWRKAVHCLICGQPLA
jgi:DNA-directed RNA polymerase subunit RPC12/RpoP